jgi:hypothetical protein
MQAFLISLTSKIYDSKNDLSEQMILLLAREIGFIQESDNWNRTGFPLMIRWFAVSIPFRTIWQCQQINYPVEFAGVDRCNWRKYPKINRQPGPSERRAVIC